MWLLVQGWLLRNVLMLLGWLAAATGVAAVLFGARQAGRNAARAERMRRTVEVQHDQLEVASLVLAIAASLLAGCATDPSDGLPCPPVVEYSREFLARAADELDSLPLGSAIEQMVADYQVMRDQHECVQSESAKNQAPYRRQIAPRQSRFEW
jgi:type IV pilus biogenesis protein CpaD/CtpE